MALNAHVEKKKNESDTSLLRRFSRKMKGTGIMREVRNRRFYQRSDSKLRRKESALARIDAGKRYEKLFKLGRITPRKRR